MSDVIEAVKRQVREPKTLNGAEFSAVDDIVRKVGKAADIKDAAVDIIADLAVRLDAAQKIIDGLPKTADGAPIVPGMKVYVLRDATETPRVEPDTVSITFDRLNLYDARERGFVSRAAALAAAKGE